MHDFIQSLTQYDTPTISNAIEVAQGTRGYERFSRGTPISAMNGAKAMCGYARTAKLSGAKPATEPPETIQARRLDYFRYMAEGDAPKICVIEDIDAPDCVSAWWGEVHTAVHRGLGVNGALTNGVMRDLDDHEPGFPVVAGSVGPSHMFCRITELDVPVTVFGLTVQPGELVHADQHGAIVIPTDVIPELQAAIDTLLANEQIVLAPARAPDFSIDRLVKAWQEFEEART